LVASFFILTVSKKEEKKKTWVRLVLSSLFYWSDDIQDPWIDEMCDQLMIFFFSLANQLSKTKISWSMDENVVTKNQPGQNLAINQLPNNSNTSAMTKLTVLVLSYFL
jgi:hypothetical protein